MSRNPVLATPKFSKPFVIECDASSFEIGAILMQDNHPIAFESKKLKEKRMPTVYLKQGNACYDACINKVVTIPIG